MAQKGASGDEEMEVGDKSGSYSATELLQQKAFAEMTGEELEAVKRLIQEMRWQASLRRSRRRTPDGRGDLLHLRQTLRTATRYAGVPLQLSWQSRKIKPRPLVVIADVSGSMEKYTRLLLQFCYSIVHSFRQVECFVFGTRLTRITRQLQVKNVDLAVDDAAREVLDWAGGTRIAASLQEFNRRWSRRVLRRGAVVLLISDGWDRGDTEALQREMRYLQHRCHRLIWLNPLLGREHYQPRVAGMAAALPYVDDFLPAHNFQSLAELAGHLGRIGPGRNAR